MVQNELLDCMLSVRRDYMEEVNSADCIAIQADETTDVSIYCQLVLLLRYVDAQGLHFLSSVDSASDRPQEPIKRRRTLGAGEQQRLATDWDELPHSPVLSEQEAIS
ncbi:hypothetical protein KUCAC02_001890 [Chaenocephalus aceratus]|uniref:Uncharacterized protein n=1 Tax=Chaenocephalus aceratus TaxID=36190 RepID=A0ACB9XSP0_CHAAC|nr:hypothetical protein KUCAC02_001890 [Chaenocephalus aceratus]